MEKNDYDLDCFNGESGIVVDFGHMGYSHRVVERGWARVRV